MSYRANNVDYAPWPDSGCSLSETRDRVGGSFFGRFGNEAQDQCASADDDLDLRNLLLNKRLVTFGRQTRPDAKAQLVNIEPLLIERVDWQESKIFGHATMYFDVRVYPLLLAPICAPDVLPAPYADVFRTYLLGDPEVTVLAHQGMEKSPQHKNIFVDGRCTVYGIKEWSVRFEGALLIGEVHPDPKKRSKFDYPIPDCIEIYLAARALKHRYAALISALRRGDIGAEGLPAGQNYPTKIPRSVWSHEKFYVDATGDIYEQVDDATSTHKFGLVRRWTGLMLNWSPTFLDRSVRSGSLDMFHDEPLARGGVPLSPIKHGEQTEIGQPQTATHVSIAEAYAALFADGSDKAISVKVRDQQIMTWQKQNKKKVASSKSITRYLKVLRARRV